MEVRLGEARPGDAGGFVISSNAVSRDTFRALPTFQALLLFPPGSRLCHPHLRKTMNRKSAAPAPPVSIWFALAALALLPASGFAQIETGRPQFDAASVKVNESGDRPFTRYDPIRVDLHKASIKHLVRRAWPLPDYQIVWPAWVDAQRGRRGYDVSVTFPPDTSPERAESYVSGSARDPFRTGDALGNT